MNLRAALVDAGQECRFLINRDEPTLRWLDDAGIPYIVVDLSDFESAWESTLIAEHGIKVWINDRLNTDIRHSSVVKRHNIPIVTFDDRGDGASMADLNIAATAFDPDEMIPGRRVLRGIEYLVLNPDIANFRRVRHEARRLLVTLGGSDTYGVTVRVASCLSKASRDATVIVGPGFLHKEELMGAIGPRIEVKSIVPSLIAEFERYDLAITGGGGTPFEANASGLPCIIVANEPFEIPVAEGLARLGGAIFAGFHEQLDESILIRDLPIERMSRAGINAVGLEGGARVVAELVRL